MQDAPWLGAAAGLPPEMRPQIDPAFKYHNEYYTIMAIDDALLAQGSQLGLLPAPEFHKGDCFLGPRGASMSDRRLGQPYY